MAFRNQSLQVKMAWVLTGLAFAVLMLAVWVLNSMDHYHFLQYVSQNREMRNQRIATVLEQAYERDGGWKQSTGIDVALLSSLEGLHIRLLDEQRRNVWDSDAASGQPAAADSHDLVTLHAKEKVIGYAEITYTDPDSYSQMDWHFRQAMSQGVISTIIPVLVLALAVSWYLAHRLSRPLIEMNRLAGQMRKGNWGIRIAEPTGGREVTQLAESLNHLSEALQKQEMLRKQLTSDVAHELRTPLATLKSHLEALTDGVWQPTKERFEVCNEEVERLIGLVQNLEKLTQAESDGMELGLEKQDLTAVALSIAELMRPSFERAGVAISFDGTEPVLLRIDANKIKQVLVNLLDNALKHTPADGSVRLQVERAGQQAVVEVSDTGAGISDEHLPYIFERFYRVDRSRTRATGGAGIGLAIVKSYVEAHGGSIQAESSLNQGTTFRITLPIQEGES